MRPVVPFVSSASPDERQSWREALPKALDGIADVKPFEDLTEDQRSEARVAIVANPDPANVAALPNLVWVQSLWAGVERLMGELPANGPKIVRLTDPQMAETMSEAVLAWTLYLHRACPDTLPSSGRRSGRTMYSNVHRNARLVFWVLASSAQPPPCG